MSKCLSELSALSDTMQKFNSVDCMWERILQIFTTKVVFTVDYNAVSKILNEQYTVHSERVQLPLNDV